MSKFERIVREPLVMGGQARIRDTGITVNEIVRLSLGGASQAEILQQFPQLEAEDVHEALGWNSEYITNLASDFVFELRGPLSSIMGYAELSHMFFQNTEPIDDKINIRNWLGEIRSHSTRVGSVIDELMFWLEFTQRIKRDAQKYLIDWNRLRAFLDDKTIAQLPIENGLFHNKVGVLSAQPPETIISLLCTKQIGYTYDSRLGIVSTKEHDGKLIFTIIRPQETALQQETLENSYYLQLAHAYLFVSGSELKILQEGNSVIFEFELPIVES